MKSLMEHYDGVWAHSSLNRFLKERLKISKAEIERLRRDVVKNIEEWCVRNNEMEKLERLRERARKEFKQVSMHDYDELAGGWGGGEINMERYRLENLTSFWRIAEESYKARRYMPKIAIRLGRVTHRGIHYVLEDVLTPVVLCAERGIEIVSRLGHKSQSLLV